jgi:gliding motility-associated-like protein
MKKFIFSICFFCFAILTSAQLSSNTGKLISKTLIDDSIKVFIFDGVTSFSEITYNGYGTSVNWYKYSNPSISIANTSYISPEGDTGYILDVDGKKTYIWVIDYKNYLSVLTPIRPDPATISPCDELNLLIDATVPPLSYESPNGDEHVIPRNFTISYQNQEWKSTEWKNVDKTIKLTLPATSYLLHEKLLADTKFTLSGDEYAELLGITVNPTISDLYSAVAVECHPTTVISPRTETNEGERPTQSTSINFSAPIDIQFLSNANLPATTYYLWEIFKNGSSSPLITRIEKDQRYTFVEGGTYKVKVTVGSTKCSYSDSITVTVSESALMVPNVFTPNGDGTNDEFRVAYKSLATFECWVFNRWGRQVFYWNDPQKGWNGKINGKDAPAGPYFYIIKAYGTDYNPKSKPDPKTKLRVGEHPKKGDINLLRGKGN